MRKITYKNNIQKYILIGFIFLSIPLFGQQQSYNYDPDLPVIIPPSPEALQYMRYGEIPVGLSTGTPEIDIPIYTLEANGLKIPISISYHASGIKVRDVAGPVGLGWVLNAGGIITQTINGAPDDYGNFKFTSHQDAVNLLREDELKYLNSPLVNLMWNNLQEKGYDSSDGMLKKTVSDRFFYRFNGNTGYFRKNLTTNEYTTIPYEPIKVNILKDKNGYYTNIELTDTEGRVWSFKKFETNFNSGSIPSFSSYEYHLEKIIFPNNSDEIIFTYQTGETYPISDETQTMYFGHTPIYNYTHPGSGFGPDDWTAEISIDWEEKLSFMKNRTSIITPVLLTNIKWRDITIDFQYKNNRKDKMKERLTDITVKNNGLEIKRARLSNDECLGDNFENYRMLLSGISVGVDEYSFSYNPTKLPAYPGYSNKCNEDFWGYYNNANGERWIPFEWSWVGNPLTNRYYEPTYIPDIREADSLYSQAGILTDIIYPTKGRTSFIYEQNKGTDVFFGIKSPQPIVDYFGGVRIKEIINYDGDTILNRKKYEYEGLPAVTITPWHIYANKQYYYAMTRRGATILDEDPFITRSASASSSGLYPLVNPYGQSHIYTKVTEYNSSGTSNTGKTEYYFDGRICGKDVTFLRTSDYGMEPVVMKAKKEYNSSGKLIIETTNKYEIIDKGTFSTGIEVTLRNETAYGVEPRDVQNKRGFHDYYYGSFGFSPHFAYRHLRLLTETTTTEHRDSNIITTTTNYVYDPQHRILSPVKVFTENSNGKSNIQVSQHAFDFAGQNIYSSMTDKNMISQVIELAQYENGDLSNPLRLIRNAYKILNNKIVPDHILTASGDTILEKRIQYHMYDSYGNPVYISKDENESIVYIWGYKGKYPIAEIKNATYKQLTEVIKEETLKLISTKSELSYQDWITLKQLRSNDKFKNSLVTIYKYKPLVGIAEIYDTRGFTTFYEYDSANRLVHVYVDESGEPKTLETYEYKYKP